MKNNIIRIDEMYSTIRKSMLQAMPYNLAASNMVSNFLQTYTGHWIESKKIEIRIDRERNQARFNGEGIEYVKNFESDEVFGTPRSMDNIKTALAFETQPDQVQCLCEDITAMLKWLLQEEYIVASGVGLNTHYTMTFKFLDRVTFDY